MTVANLEASWGRGRWRAFGRREWLLAVVLLAAQYGLTAANLHRPHAHSHPDLAGWVLLAVGPIALTAVQRHPVAVMWVCLGATLAPSGGRFVYLSLVVAFLIAASRGHRLAAWSAIVVGYGASWLTPLIYNQSLPTLQAAVLLASWLVVLVVAAEVVRARRERAFATSAAHRLDVQHRAGRQRLSMARDLHDVIGHHISLIAVQAGVGLDLMDQDPERARASLQTIRDVSKEALDELRSMLAALRQDDDEAPRAPAPGLARLATLVEPTRRLGIKVTTQVTGTTETIPDAVDLAAYRIVQESLTNVARHSGASEAVVRITYRDADLLIEVRDDGRGGVDSATASGSGITGMKERAAALGGEVEAGAVTDGFAVRATLPLRSPS